MVIVSDRPGLKFREAAWFMVVVVNMNVALFQVPRPEFMNKKLEFLPFKKGFWLRLHKAPLTPNHKNWIFRLFHTSLPLQSRLGQEALPGCVWCGIDEKEAHGHLMTTCRLFHFAREWADKLSGGKAELSRLCFSDPRFCNRLSKDGMVAYSSVLDHYVWILEIQEWLLSGSRGRIAANHKSTLYDGLSLGSFQEVC